jgi:hypothetical protein
MKRRKHRERIIDVEECKNGGEHLNIDENDGNPKILIDENDQELFELMNVQLTVYVLSGIVREAVDCKTKSGRIFSREKSNKKIRSSIPLIISSGYQSLGSTNRAVAMRRGSTGQHKNEFGLRKNVPTTAVISVQRERKASGFVMETFLPSRKLKSHLSADSSQQRYSALWTDDCVLALLDSERHMEPTTVEINRLMQREFYRPDSAIGQISNFVHQRIDLNVSVGRGCDLIPLGVASITITGDEEVEVITNAPVKPATKQEMGWKSSFGNNKQNCFADEPQFRFALEDNATLRVGVRVVSAKIREQSNFSLHQCSPEQLLFIELNDENSLFGKLVTKADHGYSDDDLCTDVTEAAIDNVKTPDSPGVRGFFCGVGLEDLKLCTKRSESSTEDKGNSFLNGGIAESKTRQDENKAKVTQTPARIMLLSKISDMSESTYDESEFDSLFDGLIPLHQAEL